MYTSVDRDISVLRSVALFQHLPDSELSALTRQASRRVYARGQIIFNDGDAGDGLYIVLDGHVGIGRHSPEGDELLLAVYEPGEYFGELALFDSEPRSASATAIDECALLFLSRTAFREFLEDHVEALFHCVEVIVRQFRRLTDVADEIALMDVRGRLARRLLHLADQGLVSAAPPGSREKGTVRITQQQLANMTGATRESINKHLHAFSDEGLIEQDRRGVHIIDLAGMREIAEGLL